MPTDRRPIDGGFALLEVLVAFIIAGLALGMLFHGAIAGLGTAQIAGGYQEAVSRAQSHLVQLARTPDLVPGDRQGEEGSGFHWRERVTRIAQTAMNSGIPLRPAAPVSLYAIRVAVTWTRDGRTRGVELDSNRIGYGRTEAP